MLLPEVVGLLEGEEVFGPPVTAQAFGEHIAAGLDAMVLEGGNPLRIAFPGQPSIKRQYPPQLIRLLDRANQRKIDSFGAEEVTGGGANF